MQRSAWMRESCLLEPTSLFYSSCRMDIEPTILRLSDDCSAPPEFFLVQNLFPGRSSYQGGKKRRAGEHLSACDA